MKKKATCLYFQWLSWEILAWRTRQNCGCFPLFWCELSNRNRPETQKQISAWERSQNSHSNSAGGPPLLTFVHIRFCHFREKLKTFWEIFSATFFFLMLHKLWSVDSVPIYLSKKLFSSVNVICTSLKFKLSCFSFCIKVLEQSSIIIILGKVCFQTVVRKTGNLHLLKLGTLDFYLWIWAVLILHEEKLMLKVLLF